MSERKRIAILGSTGSVGTQAIDVVRRNPDRFRVSAIAAAMMSTTAPHGGSRCATCTSAEAITSAPPVLRS